MKSIDFKSLLIGILGTALVMVLMGQSSVQKQYDVGNTKTLIFQEYPLPEWNFKQIIWWFLSIYLPKFYIKLKYFLNK